MKKNLGRGGGETGGVMGILTEQTRFESRVELCFFSDLASLFS